MPKPSKTSSPTKTDLEFAPWIDHADPYVAMTDAEIEAAAAAMARDDDKRREKPKE